MSRREFARVKGVSHTAINNAVRDGRIPLVDGKIDSETPYEGQQEELPAAAQAAGPRSGSRAAEELRGIKAKAEMAEMEAARRRGELVSASEVGQALQELVTSTRARLLMIPAKLGRDYGLPVQKAADEEIVSALRDLSEWRPNDQAA